MSEYIKALQHIQRNGSLLWVGCSSHEAEQLFNRMEREGHIERNVWSETLALTEAGKQAIS